MGVSPSTKETTLHHFRDPLVELVRRDPEVDLAGVAIVGSPGENSDKFYVAKRIGMLAEAHPTLSFNEIVRRQLASAQLRTSDWVAA